MHKSVLRTEVLDNLNIKKGDTFVDLTLGSAGHAKGILDRLENGKLIVFDVDRDAIRSFVGGDDSDIYQSKVGTNLVVGANINFDRLAELNLRDVNGIVIDLGWSTDQLGKIPGLSYDTGKEEILDMRLDSNLGIKASDLINGLYEKELARLFRENADIIGRDNRDLVKEIIRRRPINTNLELLNLLKNLGSHRVGALRARVFQALRIAVNNELSTLQSVLPQAWDTLVSGGRLLVITFHSGEDRIVKDAFTDLIESGEAENIFKEGFLHPSVDELSQNLRARSAKLRGIQKTK